MAEPSQQSIASSIPKGCKLSVLLAAYVVFSVLLVLGTNWFARRSVDSLEMLCRENMGQIRVIAATESEKSLSQLGEQIIRHEAESAAIQVEMYLALHPQKTIADLRQDPIFRMYAVRSVGQTGYTVILDHNHDTILFHPRPQMENIPNASMLRGKFSKLFTILQSNKGGKTSSGYYDWQEADGRVRQKFAWLTAVPHHTADGVGLSVMATIYMDEFSAKAKALDEQLNSVQSTQTRFLRQATINIHHTMIMAMVLIQGISSILIGYIIWNLLRSRRQMAQKNRALEISMAERESAEAALKGRVNLAELTADVGLVLTRSDNPRETMQLCTEAIVRRLDAAFARIWTYNPQENMLELQSSAGMYTHIDGGHSRVPIGQYKIGRIAANQLPHLNNDVSNDPEVSDREWVTREGLVAFAGYPLIVSGQLVGVMAMFARKPLADYIINALAAVADNLALAIQRFQAEETLRATNQNLKDAKLAEEAKNTELLVLLQELDMAREQVEQEHRRMEQIIFSIGSVLFSFDCERRIIQWNAMAEQVFGFPASCAMDQPLSTCRIQWDWTAINERIDECYAKDSVIRLNGFVYERPDGKTGYLNLSMNPIKSKYGDYQGMVIVAEDVTERRMLEGQLAQAQKLESIGQLAAGIAHEINTPAQYVSDSIHFLADSFESTQALIAKYRQAVDALTAGPGYEALAKEIKDCEEIADLEYVLENAPGAFERAVDGIERISTIVRAMKEFAHPDQRDKTPADLNRALQATLTIAHNEYKYVADVETELNDLPPVPCHIGDINQVFLNLIVNAAHAIGDAVGKSGKKGLIRVRTALDGNMARVEIEDTGGGIPDTIRERVFDPFFTTKEVGRGSGQGLAIARSVVVDKHGGSISFKSETGKGTTFTILLPVAKNALKTTGILT